MTSLSACVRRGVVALTVFGALALNTGIVLASPAQASPAAPGAAVPVPEPSTLIMLGAGLFFLAYGLKRRKRKN
ncbi:MAG TPA: PEP-CTERM sorting domain-containing protein [Vicinamibacterales bacterium]|nr:PEP-CTERM sorting domain-containing protein [Vicinamibacterales bacterium]